MANMDQAPLDFDREREREVAMRAEPSLFCVQVNLGSIARRIEETFLRHSKKNDNHAEQVAKIDRGKRFPAGTIKRNAKERQSTGFVVASNGYDRLRILTCAHTMTDIYTRGYHGKLTLDELNSIFTFGVHCIHHEEEIRTMVSDKMISARKRSFTPANIVAIDTELDLMVLEVESGELVRNLDDEGYDMNCEAEHPVMNMANGNPVKMQKVVLAGWPPQRPNSTVTGQVSKCDWTYDAVSGLNDKGYTMRFLEVDGMTGGSGFSGSPVLDGNCGYVGVYHGVFNEGMGYAVSLGNVNAFLQAHNMLNWGP